MIWFSMKFEWGTVTNLRAVALLPLVGLAWIVSAVMGERWHLRRTA